MILISFLTNFQMQTTVNQRDDSWWSCRILSGWSYSPTIKNCLEANLYLCWDLKLSSVSLFQYMCHFTLQVIITTPMEMLKIQLQMAGTQTTSRSHVHGAVPDLFRPLQTRTRFSYGKNLRLLQSFTNGRIKGTPHVHPFTVYIIHIRWRAS